MLSVLIETVEAALQPYKISPCVLSVFSMFIKNLESCMQLIWCNRKLSGSFDKRSPKSAAKSQDELKTKFYQKMHWNWKNIAGKIEAKNYP